MVNLLADLVRIPSINPMGRAASGTGYCEGEIAAYVASYLQAHGVDVTMTEVSPGRPNVIGFVDAGAPRTLLLEAHLDTVHADGMSIPPFAAEVRDNCLYGRGACDTKGSLAAFLYAVCALLDERRTLKHNVILAAVADEEYQFTGARHAVQQGLRADFGIAGEPTNLAIVRAHKGVVRWRLSTTGTSAHSAYPDRGTNAIYRMGRVLVRLEAYADSLQRLQPHPLLGTPTLSVGVIEGGQAVNVVPSRCTIELDRRVLPGETAGSAVNEVAALLDDLQGWTMADPHLAVQGMDIDESAPIVALLADAVSHVTGSARVEGAYYATDAGIYSAGGIPTVVFGPGDIALAHTAEEHLSLDQYAHAISIVQALLQ